MIIEQNINEEDWDNLIILDACRFDFFEKVYKEYINGKLERRISKGSNTGEWLVKTFPDKYNYNYISSNPYINSYGISLNKCHLTFRNYSWNAIEHFSKIIDVWEFGWNDKFDTVHPSEVNIAYLCNKDNRKTIIHYMQPHCPYLSYIGNHKRLHNLKLIKHVFKRFLINNLSKSPRLPIILQKIIKLTKKPNYPSSFEILSREMGIKRHHYYYEDNLRIALQNISQLIDELNGRTIITADHGEAFGEQGIWEHPIETHIPVLIEVPWLEVKSS